MGIFRKGGQGSQSTIQPRNKAVAKVFTLSRWTNLILN
jgi:hypothetical protein